MTSQAEDVIPADGGDLLAGSTAALIDTPAGMTVPTVIFPDKDDGFLRKRANLIVSLVSALVIACIWQALVNFHVVNTQFLVSPTQIVNRLYQVFFVSGSIWPNLATSLEEFAIGFMLSLVIGTAIGLAMGRFRFFGRALAPVVLVGNSMPAVAFIPLLIIWFGIGLTPKVLLVFSGGIFVMIINAERGVLMADRRLIETARSFMASNSAIVRRVLLPSAVPYIAAGIRIAVGRSLIMMVIAEIYAANRGLGYLIINAGTNYDTVDVFVGVTVLALLGFLFSYLASLLEKRVTHWQG